MPQQSTTSIHEAFGRNKAQYDVICNLYDDLNNLQTQVMGLFGNLNDASELQMYKCIPAAKTAADGVHAAVASNAVNAFPGPITQPAEPRVLIADFAASWDGGNITIVGTDQFGAAATETLASNAGGTRTSTTAFKSITSIAKTAVGATANAVTIGTGDIIGIPYKTSSVNALLFVDGVSETVSIVGGKDTFTPTTAPNGAKVFKLIFQAKKSDRRFRRRLTFAATAAKSANSVHASLLGSANNQFPGPLTAPATPRNLRVILGAGWNGGIVTCTGKDQFGTDISESFAAGTGVTRVGSKIFASLSEISKATKGAVQANNTCTVGTGDAIGLGVRAADTSGYLEADGTAEAVTIDTTNHSFTPTPVPDGAVTHIVDVNVDLQSELVANIGSLSLSKS
ncbi:MAG TPA: hypothetical protein VIU40_09250 [Geobacteraceae bacterium]